jgi:hypothetical protein
MLVEIIALFFLCRKNGALAIKKGLPAGRWKWFTILGWFAAEFTGLIFGIMIFGTSSIENFTEINELEKSNLYGLWAIGMISAFGGYLIVRSILEKKPDLYDEDINKIGINDLRPPGKE